MTSIGYYPGCSLRGTASEYELSLQAVAGRLSVELREVPDWLCCGATSAHAVDHHAALALAADTLAKARRAGLSQVLAPCAMCYQRLAAAGHELAGDASLALRVAGALGESAAPAGVQAINLLQWLESLGAEAIRSAVTRPLAGLKVACYYGCLLLRPAKVTGAGEVEAPRSMETIVQALGAQPVRWSMATECCGASFALSRKQVVLRQGQRIYQMAKKAQVDLLVMACPMCHANLDLRQREFGGGDLPALYLTQLIGLAFGIPGEKLGLARHFVSPEAALARVTSA